MGAACSRSLLFFYFLLGCLRKSFLSMKVLCDAPLDCTSLVQGSSDREVYNLSLYGSKNKAPWMLCVCVSQERLLGGGDAEVSLKG